MNEGPYMEEEEEGYSKQQVSGNTVEEGESTVDEGKNTSVKEVENNVGEGYSEHQGSE
jgi:hypothetical protein